MNYAQYRQTNPNRYFGGGRSGYAAKPYRSAQQLDLYLEVSSIDVVKWIEKRTRLGNLTVLGQISETMILGLAEISETKMLSRSYRLFQKSNK